MTCVNCLRRTSAQRARPYVATRSGDHRRSKHPAVRGLAVQTGATPSADATPNNDRPPVKFKTIIDPFRLKTVEPIRQTTDAQRAAAIRAAHYNVFKATWTTWRRCCCTSTSAKDMRGVRIVEQPPVLRHFTAKFGPLKTAVDEADGRLRRPQLIVRTPCGLRRRAIIPCAMAAIGHILSLAKSIALPERCQWMCSRSAGRPPVRWSHAET